MKKIFLLISAFIFSTAFSHAQYHFAVKGGGNGADKGFSVVHDDSGNSYYTGSFSGNGTFGIVDLVSQNAGGTDAYVVKYTAEGAAEWGQHAGGTGITESHTVAANSAGEVWIAGSFTDSVLFGNTILVSAGMRDIFIAKLNASGQFVWAKRAGGIEDDEANAVAVNSYGAAFIAGYFSDDADFDGATVSSSGNEDIFIARYDNNGNFLWAKKAGGFSADRANALVLDNGGSLFVTGSIKGAAHFSNFQVSTNYSKNVFLAKYTPSGSVQWVEAGGSIEDDEAFALALNNSFNISVTGYISSGNAVFGTHSVNGNGGKDVFVVTYSASGTVVDLIRDGGVNDETGFGIAIDNLNNTYISGSFLNATTLGGNQLTSGGLQDAFVIKYNSGNEPVRVKHYYSEGDDAGLGVSVDNSGNCVSTGYFSSNASFENTSLSATQGSDAFLATFSDSIEDNGGLLVTHYHAANSGLPSNNIVKILTDRNNRLWVATAESGIARFDGNTWTSYNASNSPLSNNVNSLFEDSISNIWVSTTDSGLYKFDGTNWTHFNTSNSNITTNNITAVTSFGGGPLWVGTANNGCLRLIGSNFTPFTTGNSAIPSNSISTMNCDSTRHYWIGTKENGLAKFFAGTFTLFNSSNSAIPDNHINGAYYDNDSGKVWVATDAGISYFDGTQWNLFNTGIDSDAAFNELLITRNQNHYVGGSKRNGSTIDGEVLQLVGNTSNHFFDNNINGLAQDSSGSIIWAASQYSGLYMMQVDTSTTGIETGSDLSTKISASCFPNPAGNEVTLKIQTAFSSPVNLTMIDVYGKIVAQQSIAAIKSGTVLHTISLEHTASGIYFIAIEQQNEFISLKLVKH